MSDDGRLAIAVIAIIVVLVSAFVVLRVQWRRRPRPTTTVTMAAKNTLRPGDIITWEGERRRVVAISDDGCSVTWSDPL